MIASELRKGNLIEHIDWENEVVEFVCLDQEAPDHRLYWRRLGSKEIWDMGSPIGGDYTKAIPLTEEWLLKFGFEKDYETRSWSILTSLVKFDYCFEISNKYQEFFQPDFLGIDIQYVHQLQNLYFALTGEELTITE